MANLSAVARDYVACRTLGHAWDSIPVPRSEAVALPPGSIWLWLRCTRCSTERKDAVSAMTGYVDRRRYEYPDGYSRAGEDPIARDDWRKQYLALIGSRTRKRREERASA